MKLHADFWTAVVPVAPVVLLAALVALGRSYRWSTTISPFAVATSEQTASRIQDINSRLSDLGLATDDPALGAALIRELVPIQDVVGSRNRARRAARLTALLAVLSGLAMIGSSFSLAASLAALEENHDVFLTSSVYWALIASVLLLLIHAATEIFTHSTSRRAGLKSELPWA